MSGRSPIELLRWVKATLTPGDDISGRAVTSGIWASMANVIGRGLQLVKLVVLANILTPVQFGLVAYALLTLAAMRRFSNLGIKQALIQKEEDNINEYLDTAWTLSAVRGAILASIGFLAAPYIARDFFGAQPPATQVIQVMSLVPLITGIQNPGIVYFRKDLDYDKQFVYLVGKAVAAVSVTIGLALLWGNVWSLVVGDIAGVVVATSLSYVLHGYRPWPSIDMDQTRELVGYGKWITASGIIVFLITEGDDVFVGWLLGSAAIGLYQYSYKVSNAPATEVTKVLTSVIFPTYSKLQNDAANLRRAFFKTVQLTTFISIPLAAGIVAVAPAFVHAFLGPEWVPAIPIMQLLAVWGLLRSIGATTGPLFQAVGKPDLATKIQVGKLAIILLTIYPATAAYGVIGTSAVIVGNSVLFSEPVSTYLAVREVEGSYRQFLRLLLYPLVASIGMVAVVVFVGTKVPVGGIPKFGIMVATGVVVYGAAIVTMELWGNYGIRDVFRTMVGAVGE
ncbi:export protein [Haladaptatus paucihalophilus DX253]|uniref:Export protein n=1 Tax=Haladaptatus paucihalophilus DX253 TaxID=797209 RepID=E7QW44_HALPU|nr:MULTISPECIES: lipopolysaccharide biosynthesis protein [Haladaptatus]EFW91178.1 export protein [Haladaptatus paucihalophilus DX253]GKZ16338.1 lipopolysaccharide biosynthesis protein [Haladaptatus sp. T7]SHL66925.1 polysaccharide transporter, PST family/lipopolysaccharide exporter [Haladaptatus paucihalophilus DX253]